MRIREKEKDKLSAYWESQPERGEEGEGERGRKEGVKEGVK